ncbi:hypothetical protein LG288_07850 [Idiomarina seosinensis]|uniref:hypothetical protein n=1 Tax=Idiomarina seosinensis TaxID=281739 RepID=UPI00384D109E
MRIDNWIKGFSGILLFFAVSFSINAQQSLSQRLSDQLTQSADQQLDIDLQIKQLLVSALTEQLTADQVTLATRVPALSEPLNQLILADRLQLKGNWQVLGQRSVTLTEIQLSGAQLTLAYYGKGQSNLHDLLDRIQRLADVGWRPANAFSESVLWRIDRLQFDDVTVNLFDQGQPIASVHLPGLVLEGLQQSDNSNDNVRAMIFPVIDQLLDQWREGQADAQIDGPALTRFLLREALAF